MHIARVGDAYDTALAESVVDFGVIGLARLVTDHVYDGDRIARVLESA